MTTRVWRALLVTSALLLSWAAMSGGPRPVQAATARCNVRNGIDYCCINGMCRICDSVQCFYVPSDPSCPGPCA